MEPDADNPDAGMWKLCPDSALSSDDSTEGNGSFASSTSGGGGVSAF